METGNKVYKSDLVWILPGAVAVLIAFYIGSYFWSVSVNPQYIEFEARVSDIQYVRGGSLFSSNDEYVIYFDNGRVVNVYESVVNVPGEFAIGEEYYVKFVKTRGRGLELAEKETR